MSNHASSNQDYKTSRRPAPAVSIRGWRQRQWWKAQKRKRRGCWWWRRTQNFEQVCGANTAIPTRSRRQYIDLYRGVAAKGKIEDLLTMVAW